MKISYKIIKKYLPYVGSASEVAEKLILHTAEVEDIYSQMQEYQHIVIGVITHIEKHPDADSLQVCQVDVGETTDIQIVCWGSNLFVWQKVAVAKLGASVVWHGQWDPVVMKKTSIRWVESFWMICASEEIWLKKEFPSKDEKEILDLSFLNSLAWVNIAVALQKDDEILEVDNKAINHRPDMFSYMGILREIATIYGKNFDVEYVQKDFSNFPVLKVENLIPEVVKRYSLIQVCWVKNITSNSEIQTIIQSAWHGVKWLLVDISNYSLYFYGQPAHIFDADKIEWNIVVRYARNWETLEALDDRIYQLDEQDIVIADTNKILALGWIIWGKSSAVSDSTTNIFIETAHFDQAVLRKTGKRLWVRTDALNVFEKDIVPDLAGYAISFIIKELQKEFPNLKIEWSFDSYTVKQFQVTQKFDITFYNNLIGSNYQREYIINILQNLWVQIEWDTLKIPFWRKELTTKADIAEEIARISWYDTILPTIPRINLWATVQDAIYALKNDSKKYFADNWFFEVYNYSFVNQELQEKLSQSVQSLIPLKNYLSEDATHLRWSLIPNLMKWLEENIRNIQHMKLFEIEKIFSKKDAQIIEWYRLSGVMTSNKDIAYYEVQSILCDFLKSIFVDAFYFEVSQNPPEFSHKGRVAKIIARGKEIWYVWEIHPSVAKRFDVHMRVWFFEIDADILAELAYNKVKVKEVSPFQQNTFDVSILIEKESPGREVLLTLQNIDKELIQKVELIDIYQDDDKLWQKRSLTFRVYVQSLIQTLNDDIMSALRSKILEKIQKKWWEVR